MLEQLRETCRKLLADGTVQVVIGYGQATADGPAFPIFVTRPEDCDRLVWNERCFNNLTTYLKRKEVRALGKPAVVVKGCDAKALVVLEQESQLNRAEMVAVGVCCAGVGNPTEAKCAACDVHTPQHVDVVIDASPLPRAGVGTTGSPLPRVGEGPGVRAGSAANGNATSAATNPHPNPLPQAGEGISRYADVAALLARSPAARLAFWQEQLARCVKCYACRQVCPLCYCERCIVDKNRPQVIDSSPSVKGNFAWHITRAFHLAGRCIGCDECTRACPAGIDLRLLNLALAQAAEDNFAYRAGTDPAAEPLLGSFSLEDKETFIR